MSCGFDLSFAGLSATCSASAKEHYSNLAIPPANRLHISLDPSIKSSQHMVAVTAESSDSEAYCEQVDLMRTLMSQLTGGPFFVFGLVLCYLSHRLARVTPWAAKHFQEHHAAHDIKPKGFC